MPRTAPPPTALLVVTLCAMTALAGCTTPDADSASAAPADPAAPAEATAPAAYTKLPPTGTAGDCGPDSGVTHVPGVLTIATDSPAFAPWFVGDDPANGKGFEGSVARAVAQRMGYPPDRVTFVRVPWSDAITPGAKNFDFDIDQFTITGDRRENVDFSSPYYAVTQAIVALDDSPAALARNLSDLTGFRLGAQSGSTSLAAIETTIRPTHDAVEFATTEEARSALADGRIDALAVDIPTGFQITESDLPDSVLVGQFPRPNAVTEFFGLVLGKNSPLTACTSAAVDGLYQDGTLDTLAQTWLIDSIGTPILE